ncbi:MAG: TlpA family protein disulfide reductase [Planctomycetes bacterium]|nr:TlpA family protein disulfide reductase [Planctomycetota bacterium]
MRRPSVLWIAIALAVGAVAGASPARASGRDFTGSPAPELAAPEGLSGYAPGTSLASLRGHPVVLKFMFTTCPACQGSMPEFERLHRRYAPRGVVCIAVAYDSRPAVEAMWARNGYTVPVAVDAAGSTPRRYGVTTYPTSYLIGADGIVRSYDYVSDALLERELARGGVSAPAPVVAASSSASSAERNVAELGEVPSALAAAKDAAARNDYGAVLRVVEAHLDADADPADVVAAARRIQTVAKRRCETREARIEERWSRGDRVGAYEALVVAAEDFHGTTCAAHLEARVKAVRDYLVREGIVSVR